MDIFHPQNPIHVSEAIHADILGLGENTHANFLFNKWRAQQIKYLIEFHGFRCLAFEDDVIYVQQVFYENKPITQLNIGNSSPITLDLLNWIKTWNANHKNDQVYIFGLDTQEQHQSNETKEGKLYSKYMAKTYSNKKGEGHEKRDEYMFEIFQELYGGRKTIIIMHNSHLTKEIPMYGPSISLALNDGELQKSDIGKHHPFGAFINKKLKHKKYVVIANTFTKGSFFTLKAPVKYPDFVVTNAFINIKDHNYSKQNITLFTKPPTHYIYEGLLAFNPKKANRYFNKVPSQGYDMVILINNEKPLNVYRNNRFLWNRSEFIEEDKMNVLFENFDPKSLPVHKNIV